MRRLLAALALCLVALAPARARELFLVAGADGAVRNAVAVVPDDLAAPAPVLVVLHGAFETGPRIRRESGERFDALGAAHGWVIVYPSACNRLWNPVPGPICGDDLRHLDALVEALAAEVAIDRSRVFAAGFSQGGALALAWACTEPGRLRAVAAISMSLPAPLEDACRTAPPGGVLLIHGTADSVIAAEGGETLIGAAPPVDLLGFEPSVAVFRVAKGCTGAPATQSYDRADDRTRVIRRSWTACRTGALEAFEIFGGGHRWPNARPQSPFAVFLGPATREIDGAAAVFGFFSRFR